ncbi:hypothetical protein AYO44_14525 [Planctomycetaceae bacterium SCGC AG-212-F19]|nr:hypothetical protein AYO44_14525 [Planctomycetaceae bacterium SCGC AG-212-F19]
MPPPSEGTVQAETADLLRQMLEIQKEQLALQKQAAQAHDMGARWRAYLAKWQRDFPELPENCRTALPILERSYGALITDLAEHLRNNENEALDNEFALGDFLDRYGMRLSQLGTILSLVAFLAEAAGTGQSQAGEQQSG